MQSIQKQCFSINDEALLTLNQFHSRFSIQDIKEIGNIGPIPEAVLRIPVPFSVRAERGLNLVFYNNATLSK
jgi:hypothetical protein